MARICGVACGDSARFIHRMTVALSAGSVAPEELSSKTLETGDTVLGWRGRGAPSAASRGALSIVLDGFVFNREQLGRSDSDAELLLDLYEKQGFARALEQVNGDFAVALYDASSQELWLARDRFGLKPLYYAQKDGRFAFASRPRALFELPGVSNAPRREFTALFAASHYRTFDNARDKSPYEDVAQLPAGQWLRISRGRLAIASYWDLEDRGDSSEGEAALAERYRELLLDAVAIRLRSAPDRAFTLSGGMDSSSVLACAVHAEERKQHAFSTTYEDPTYDETSEIKTMLAQNVERWHPIRVGTPDVESLVTRMLEAHDEPVATATWLSHFVLCQEVRKEGFTELFGGLGGDELNAGEYEYFFFFFADICKDEKALLRETERWVAHHDHPVFKKNELVMRDGLERLTDLKLPGACRADRKRLERYKSVLNPDYFRLEEFHPVLDRVFSSYLKNRTHHDIFRETLPCCARAQDRHGEAFGIQHFLPFLDHRLVEFMFRVPSRLKIKDGVTKHLLRSAMKGILPEETRTRIKKTGWNAPAHIWFSGRGRELLMDLIGSRSFRERGLYNPVAVERLLADHERIVSSSAPEDNHMMFFWQLVNLELWLRSLDRKPASA